MSRYNFIYPRIFLAFLLTLGMGIAFLLLCYFMLRLSCGGESVETAEFGSYVLGSLMLPVWGWIGCRLAARWKPLSPRQLAFCGLGAGLGITLLIFTRHEFLKLTQLEYSTRPLFWIAALLAGGLAAAVLVLPGRRRSHIWLVCGLALAVLAMLTTKLYPVNYLHLLFIHHFDVVIHAITMATRGEHALHMYGNYPWFLAPVFGVCGLSVRSVSLLLALLFLATFGTLITTMHFSLRNRMLTLMFSLLLLFYGCFWFVFPQFGFDPYYQYHPVRSLFPALAAAYVFFCRAPSGKFFTGGGILAGLALIWNMESGVAVTGGLCFLLLLEWIARRKSDWSRWLPVQFFGAAAAVFLFWYLLCSLQAGIWRNPFGQLLLGQNFIDSGNMLPMPPLPADWLAFLLVNAAGVVTGLYQALRNPAKIHRREVYFPALLGVMGFGIFVYYIGRSHEGNLLAAAYLTWMLAVWLLDRTLVCCRRNRPAMLWLFLFFPLFWMLGFALIGTGMRIPTLLLRAQHMPASYLDWSMTPFDADAEFVKQCANGRPVNIWGQFHGVLMAETNLPPAIPSFNQAEHRTPEAFQDLLRQLWESDAPLFLCNGVDEAGELPRLPPELVQKYYTLIAVSPGERVLYFEPRRSE